MENFNNIPNSGTYGAAIALINANFQLAKEQLERLEYSREGFCGMYDTLVDLQSAYPNPASGSFAYVGESFPMTVYKVSGGSWYASSSTYDGGGIDLTQYASASDLTSLQNTVTSLRNAGYVFAGIASTSVVPNTLDANRRFYIAWTPATYTNYGNYTVNEGELAVMAWNGSVWSNSKTEIVAKSIVGGYDATPTEDSTKPVTSGGVYDALGGLQQTLEGEIANVNVNFQSGEQLSSVSIIQGLGQGTSAIASQKSVSDAIFNTVDINDLDLMSNYANNRLDGTLARYTVTAYYINTTYKVGMLDVFSDTMGHVLTQVLTTHCTFTDGQLNPVSHSDGALRQYYRSAKINGGTLPVDQGEWTEWKVMNDEVFDSISTSISSIESVLDYTETIITDVALL